MAHILCIANQKGGVGKTTTCVNLSSALARRGHPVLLVDMDPQGNATSGLRVIQDLNATRYNIYHALVGIKSIKDVILDSKQNHLKVIPTDSDLVGAEVELMNKKQREFYLKALLQSVEKDFEFILIDCPPSLGLLTVNSLVAAKSFLVPLQCEYYALEGLSQLLNTAGLIRKSFNPSLELEGIVLTMFDSRNNLNHQVVEEIRSHFGSQVFESVIPRSIRLSEAPGYGCSIFEYDDKSSGAFKYSYLAEEIEKKYQLEPKTKLKKIETQDSRNKNKNFKKRSPDEIQI